MLQTTEADVLAPFEIWEVPFDGGTIKFKQPLVCQPAVLPAEGPNGRSYLICDVPELNIAAHGINRDWLRKCIDDDIRITWKHSVKASPEKQTRKSLVIRNRYLEIAEEISNG